MKNIIKSIVNRFSKKQSSDKTNTDDKRAPENIVRPRAGSEDPIVPAWLKPVEIDL